MEGLLKDMSGVVVYLDDILITGKDQTEHMENLGKVLKRQRETGLRLQQDKCQSMKDSVVYLGHRIDKDGLLHTEEKVRAIRDAPIPRGVSELKAYLGMLTYYSKFLPDRATVLAPLHALLQKGATWKWSEDEDKAFQESKRLLTSTRVLVDYTTKLPLLLACDASPFGLGAVLSHRLENGNEHPIAFASRSLSPAEKNYSQIDREEAVIVFGVSKFHRYIYGRHFELLSDHQPLRGLLGEGRSIPVTASARIQRWALLLAGYQYTFRYKAGRRHNNADALSRVPLLALPHHKGQPEAILHVLEQLEKLPVTATQIAWWTTNDPILCFKCEHGLEKAGHKKSSRRCTSIQDKELRTVEAYCVVWGTRVVIPSAGRTRILTELHEAHPGTARIKGLARGVVWWPSLTQRWNSWSVNVKYAK